MFYSETSTSQVFLFFSIYIYTIQDIGTNLYFLFAISQNI
uniref:Uncharacterized protein n=1 Tax=Rhizophora mucronata TaxID=61149 RepID=A0A2P2QR63_RHIMU